MTTPTGRALAGMLAVIAEFEREIMREPVKAGIAQARSKGITLGRPKSAAKKTSGVQRLYRKESSQNPRSQDASASAGSQFEGCWRVSERSK
jgi:putative DNA-invertase from lambdoid prophage Rac